MNLRNLAVTGEMLPKNLTFLGLDYSQNDFYVDCDGKKANYPHYYKKSEEKLGKLQARLGQQAGILGNLIAEMKAFKNNKKYCLQLF